MAKRTTTKWQTKEILYFVLIYFLENANRRMYYSTFHFSRNLHIILTDCVHYFVDYYLSIFRCSFVYCIVCLSSTYRFISLVTFFSHFDLLKHHCSVLGQTWIRYALDGRFLTCVRWLCHTSRMNVVASDWLKNGECW